MLNIAYNALCDRRCLQDLELRRQDEAYLNALGPSAPRIPDPTTAGDFCRRFTQDHLDALRQEQAIDFTRAQGLGQSARPVFRTGDSRRRWHNGRNRWRVQTGNGHFLERPVGIPPAGDQFGVYRRSPAAGPSLWQPPVSTRRAAAKFDESIALCRAAGFRSIRLRGDTDFSQTQHLDRWHEQGDVTFCFGLDVTGPRSTWSADDLPQTAWKPLNRSAKYQVKTKPRAAREARQAADRGIAAAASKTFGWSTSGLPSGRIALSPASTPTGLVILRKNLAGERTATAAIIR